MHDFGKFNHSERILWGRLHNNCATNRKSGGNLAGHVDEGEVVRRDASNDADWLTMNNATDETTGCERSCLHC